METIFAVASFIIGLITTGVVIFLLFRLGKQKEAPKQDDTAFKLLFQQMNELTRTMDTKMGESARVMNESVRTQFGESAKLIREVTQGLTKLDETNRQVVSFADQLQNLQDILKNPKQRGVLGEYYLETLLKNVLPP